MPRFRYLACNISEHFHICICHQAANYGAFIKYLYGFYGLKNVILAKIFCK